MKKSSLALMMMGLVASSATQAAEVYNKDGNKLDVYGKVKAMHYISDYDSKDGDQTYVRFGIKGETQINDQLTGYGRWESEFSGNKTESDSTQKTRLAFAGLKLKNYGSFDYGRNLGALYDVEAWTRYVPGIRRRLFRTDRQLHDQTCQRSGNLPQYRFLRRGGWPGYDSAISGQKRRPRSEKQNGDGFGTSLSYDFGGSDFAISAAYTSSDRTNDQNLLARGVGKKRKPGRPV